MSNGEKIELASNAISYRVSLIVQKVKKRKRFKIYIILEAQFPS